MKKLKPARRAAWQIAILALSFYSIVVLSMDITIKLDPEVKKAVKWADFCICTIFLADFFGRLKTEGISYLKYGWIDLLGSIPTVGLLRGARLFRVFKIIRIIKGVGYLAIMRKNKAMSSLILSSIFAVLVYWTSVILVLHFEMTAEAGNIKNINDALWWGIVTITTVGYGDFYPVTTPGRIAAVFLMVTGIGVFANTAGAIASKLQVQK